MRSRRFAAIKQRMQAGLRFRVVLSLCQTRNSPRGFVLRPKTQLDLFHTKKKEPRPKPGLLGNGRYRFVLLVRQQQLREACRVHVAEERRARRQKSRSQEFNVKVVTAAWRAIYRGAALEDAVGLSAVIHADDGA